MILKQISSPQDRPNKIHMIQGKQQEQDAIFW